MKTMAALAAPPSRAAAPPSDAGGADGNSDGSFAAVLGQARDPVKAAVDRPAKTQAKGPPSAEPKAPAKPSAAREPARNVDAKPAHSADAEPGDAAASAADAPKLLLPVPGWPAAASAPEAASADLLPAVAATLGDNNASIELDSTLSLDEGATLANAITPGKPRMVKATLPGLAPADVAAGKPDATAAVASAATTATAVAAIAMPALSTKPATDAVAMSAPMLSALPAPVANATPAAPAAASHAATLPFAAHLAATVDSPAFAPAFATQVSWLAKEGLQHARLTLNPAELGPVAVKIMLDGTQARIDFHAAIASTRAAIEASLPTLAAALHDHGMTLAGGGVSDGQARPGAQGDRAPAGQDPAHRSANGEPHDPQSAALPLRTARGLVDLVA